MISNAQKNAVKATSKTLFSNMVNGLERYKDEYGYFPNFLTSRDRTNLEDGNNAENFVKAVTGVDCDGKKLSQAAQGRSSTARAANFWNSALTTSCS